MEYRIEYADAKYPVTVHSREALLEHLKKPEGTVTDVRKVYKSGVSDSVMEKYKRYIPDAGKEKNEAAKEADTGTKKSNQGSRA